MKNIIFFLTAFLMVNTIFSQSERLSREKIDAYKKLYLTDKLKLDPSTETAFWTAYKTYEDSLYKLNRERRQEFVKLRSNNVSISDEEFPKMIDNYMNHEKRKVEFRGKLISELKEVMSFRKTFMLFRYEEDFRREMMEKLRKQRKEK
ncbi:MAG: hypothetical protein ACJ0NM_04200 [Flavobacteriaceae bacterium]|jgi:hypothetical protein|tara:strand:+ start:6266 stop:6709 length:444 start_codon:yes stop_codon:yes gene_type:complete